LTTDEATEDGGGRAVHRDLQHVGDVRLRSIEEGNLRRLPRPLPEVRPPQVRRGAHPQSPRRRQPQSGVNVIKRFPLIADDEA
jgi:hypothetical protein